MREDKENISGWKRMFGMQRDLQWKINGVLGYLKDQEIKHAEQCTA